MKSKIKVRTWEEVPDKIKEDLLTVDKGYYYGDYTINSLEVLIKYLTDEACDIGDYKNEMYEYRAGFSTDHFEYYIDGEIPLKYVEYGEIYWSEEVTIIDLGLRRQERKFLNLDNYIKNTEKWEDFYSNLSLEELKLTLLHFKFPKKWKNRFDE